MRCSKQCSASPSTPAARCARWYRRRWPRRSTGQTLTLRPGSFVDSALHAPAHRSAVLGDVARRRRGARLSSVRASEHAPHRRPDGLPPASLPGPDLGALARRSSEGEDAPDDHPDRDVSRRDAVVGAPVVRRAARRAGRRAAGGRPVPGPVHVRARRPLGDSRRRAASGRDDRPGQAGRDVLQARADAVRTSSRSSAAGWTSCARWPGPRTDWRRWRR